MDNIDPLNTIDPQAPHSSTFSSNKYLTKPSTTKPNKGTLCVVGEDADISEGVWWAAVGMDMLPENFDIPSQAAVIGHLHGFKLHLSEESPGAYLSEDSKSNSFVKLYGINEEEATKKGTNIGEHKGKPIYGNLNEHRDTTLNPASIFEVLCRVFDKYDPSILNYYIYHHTGLTPTNTSPPEVEINSLDQEAQYLDLRSMIK
jgi:hypothetical protein